MRIQLFLKYNFVILLLVLASATSRLDAAQDFFSGGAAGNNNFNDVENWGDVSGGAAPLGPANWTSSDDIFIDENTTATNPATLLPDDSFRVNRFEISNAVFQSEPFFTDGVFITGTGGSVRANEINMNFGGKTTINLSGDAEILGGTGGEEAANLSMENTSITLSGNAKFGSGIMYRNASLATGWGRGDGSASQPIFGNDLYQNGSSSHSVTMSGFSEFHIPDVYTPAGDLDLSDNAAFVSGWTTRQQNAELDLNLTMADNSEFRTARYVSLLDRTGGVANTMMNLGGNAVFQAGDVIAFGNNSDGGDLVSGNTGTITINQAGNSTIQAGTDSGAQLGLTNTSSGTSTNQYIAVGGGDSTVNWSVAGTSVVKANRLIALGVGDFGNFGGGLNDGSNAQGIAVMNVSGGTVTVSGNAPANPTNTQSSSGRGRIHPSGKRNTELSTNGVGDRWEDSGGDMFVGYQAQSTGELNISGTGTIDVARDLVVGRIPGANGTLSVEGSSATIEVGGNLTFGDAGSLDARITGNSHTTIQVGGDALLSDGSLSIELSGYTPVGGESYTLIDTVGSVSGMFASFDTSMATLPAGFSWILDYSSSDKVVLSIDSPFDPADFDMDGDVDGDDLAQWEGDFGINSDSDANGDGNTNGADFLAWQRQYTGLAGVTSTATTVPEPNSWCLLIIGGFAIILSRSTSLTR